MTEKRLVTGSIIGILLSVLAFNLVTPFAVKAGGSNAPGLEGSWNVVVGAGSPTEFRSLVTFTAGGGLMATAPALPPGFHGSTVHGTWVRSGGKQFTYTFLSLIYDSAGQFAGTLKVRETITLNAAGDQYDGVSSIDVLDPTGNPIPPFSSCGGTSLGRRIEVEVPICP